jgi:hypothetical protein
LDVKIETTYDKATERNFTDEDGYTYRTEKVY